MDKYCHWKGCGKEIEKEYTSLELRAHEKQAKICMYFDSRDCLKAWLRDFMERHETETEPERWELREFERTGKICRFFNDIKSLCVYVAGPYWHLEYPQLMHNLQ
jgi:hypothetical protein